MILRSSSNVLIALHRAPGVVGSLIRWQTRSQYSHASLYCPGFGIIEAREGKGVQRLTDFQLKAGERVDLFRVNGVTDEETNNAWMFAAAQIGKPYDWTMVLRFVSRRQESRASTGKWFCSELVYASWKSTGVELLRATEPWEVSPGLLGRSPYLTHERTLISDE